MTQRHDSDGDLSPDARSYVQTLRTPTAREAARDYARMDDQSFRARMGPALDEMGTQLTAVLTELRRPPPTPPRRLSRRVLAALAVFGGFVGNTLLSILHVSGVR